MSRVSKACFLYRRSVLIGTGRYKKLNGRQNTVVTLTEKDIVDSLFAYNVYIIKTLHNK